jgi:hypothetical protein
VCANTHWVEARLDRALKSRRLGLTLGEVGIDLRGMGQIVGDDEVYIRQCHAWKLLHNFLGRRAVLESDNDDVQKYAGAAHADGQRLAALGIKAK